MTWAEFEDEVAQTIWLAYPKPGSKDLDDYRHCARAVISRIQELRLSAAFGGE